MQNSLAYETWSTLSASWLHVRTTALPQEETWSHGPNLRLVEEGTLGTTSTHFTHSQWGVEAVWVVPALASPKVPSSHVLKDNTFQESRCLLNLLIQKALQRWEREEKKGRQKQEDPGACGRDYFKWLCPSQETPVPMRLTAEFVILTIDGITCSPCSTSKGILFLWKKNNKINMKKYVNIFFYITLISIIDSF